MEVKWVCVASFCFFSAPPASFSESGGERAVAAKKIDRREVLMPDACCARSSSRSGCTCVLSAYSTLATTATPRTGNAQRASFNHCSFRLFRYSCLLPRQAQPAAAVEAILEKEKHSRLPLVARSPVCHSFPNERNIAVATPARTAERRRANALCCCVPRRVVDPDPMAGESVRTCSSFVRPPCLTEGAPSFSRRRSLYVLPGGG